MAKKKKTADPTFEELLAETEAAVEALESGELSLEESMEKYELGVHNLKSCSAFITEAQKKVEQLIVDKLGQPGLAEFEEEAE